MLKREKILDYYEKFKILFDKYYFKYEWGFFREELVEDEEMFNWFYCSPDFIYDF